jgi:excisionase family DNA binding protein
MGKFTKKPRNNYTPHMDDLNIPALPGYVSVQEAAEIIGCSGKRVYQYVREGRLPAQKIGNMFVLPLEAVRNFKPAPSGRARSKTPPWRVYRSRGKLLVTDIQAQIKIGMREELLEKFHAVDQEELMFTGTIARYVFANAESIEIMLVWKDTEMPDEGTRKQDLLSFQQAFADVVDWETTRVSSKDVFLHT